MQDAAVVHAAVKALGKDERYRADFEVVPEEVPDEPGHHPAALQSAQPFRVPARRFGYILQVAKERYKDDSLQLGDAGEKVKALINEHLISLGINPKVPPVELLAEDFLQRICSSTQAATSEAKASEMEHAIRKHCTVHHDEDPAFYKKLSEKVDALIERHHDEWDLLVEKLDELRVEAVAGRKQGVARPGPRGQYLLRTHCGRLAIGEARKCRAADLTAFKALMEALVERLQADHRQHRLLAEPR